MFLAKLLVGIGLFYFAAFESGIYPRPLALTFIEGKLKLFKVASKYFLVYAGLFVLMVGVLVGVFTILDAFFKTPGGHSQMLGIGSDILRFNALSSSAPGGAVFFLLGACALTPIIEELFYRQLLFSKLRKHFDFLASMSVSSLVFGFFHANILLAVIDGVYLAYVYEKEKNLPVNIILHAQLNLFSIILMVGFKKLWVYMPT